MITNPQLIKYILLVTKKAKQSKQSVKIILNTCTQNEMHSLACDWNRTDLQHTCQRKILEKWAEQGDQVYTDNVQQRKEEYMKVIDELKKDIRN
ncbi:unnamed protein product [Rotaria sordida]|nr:unnamed protein product [Rotaria sordida]